MSIGFTSIETEKPTVTKEFVSKWFLKLDCPCWGVGGTTANILELLEEAGVEVVDDEPKSPGS